jgi:hypothetical protein
MRVNQDVARPQQIRSHVCPRSLKFTRRSVAPVAFAVDRAPISNWPNKVRA